MQDRLFVFGTLLSGYDHPMARLLSREATLIGPARCQGRLYRVAHYPGMVPSSDPADQVIGELYQLPDSDDLLRTLDGYEQYGEAFPPPNEFLRRHISVTGDDGAASEAWTYLYNRPVAYLPRIMSGRFLGQQA